MPHEFKRSACEVIRGTRLEHARPLGGESPCTAHHFSAAVQRVICMGASPGKDSNRENS
jgi:hypothetical protein